MFAVVIARSFITGCTILRDQDKGRFEDRALTALNSFQLKNNTHASPLQVSYKKIAKHIGGSQYNVKTQEFILI